MQLALESTLPPSDVQNYAYTLLLIFKQTPGTFHQNFNPAILYVIPNT